MLLLCVAAEAQVRAPWYLRQTSDNNKLLRAMLTRDIALQTLHYSDLLPNSTIASRLREVADRYTELDLPAADVASGIFLPLNELLRVRDCSPSWSAAGKTRRGVGLCHDGSSIYEQLAEYAKVGERVKQALGAPTFCETGFKSPSESRTHTPGSGGGGEWRLPCGSEG